MVSIPFQLIDANARFIKVRKGEKRACESDWPNHTYAAHDPEMVQWLLAGNNYGVITRNNVCSMDIDNYDEFKKLNISFPQTFTDRRMNHNPKFLRYHVYFICDDVPENMRTKHETAFGDIRLGGNFYTVGTGCVAPSDIGILLTYEVASGHPIRKLRYAEVQQFLKGKESLISVENSNAEVGKSQPIRVHGKVGVVSSKAFRVPDVIRQGHRDNTMSEIARYFHNRNLGDILLPLMEMINESRCQPPMTNEEVARVVKSALKYKVRVVKIDNSHNCTELFTLIERAERLGMPRVDPGYAIANEDKVIDDCKRFIAKVPT